MDTQDIPTKKDSQPTATKAIAAVVAAPFQPLARQS